MVNALAAISTALEHSIREALSQQLMSNRGTFAPFRVPAVATALTRALVETSEEGATALGASLGKEGLSLSSLMAAQTAALQAITQPPALDTVAEAVVQVSRAFAALLGGHAAAEAAELQRQRDEIERAFRSSLAEGQEQEERLREAIRELSTPIIPLYEGILVLPLVGAVDSRRANQITEQLLEAIAFHQAELVIMDITGVSVLDTSTANHLLMTTRAAALLGSRVVLTGMGPEIAQSVVHLGVDLRGLVTLANLRAGLSYALAQLNLGIRSLP